MSEDLRISSPKHRSNKKLKFSDSSQNMEEQAACGTYEHASDNSQRRKDPRSRSNYRGNRNHYHSHYGRNQPPGYSPSHDNQTEYHENIDEPNKVIDNRRPQSTSHGSNRFPSDNNNYFTNSRRGRGRRKDWDNFSSRNITRDSRYNDNYRGTEVELPLHSEVNEENNAYSGSNQRSNYEDQREYHENADTYHSPRNTAPPNADDRRQNNSYCRNEYRGKKSNFPRGSRGRGKYFKEYNSSQDFPHTTGHRHSEALLPAHEEMDNVPSANSNQQPYTVDYDRRGTEMGQYRENGRGNSFRGNNREYSYDPGRKVAWNNHGGKREFAKHNSPHNNGKFRKDKSKQLKEKLDERNSGKKPGENDLEGNTDENSVQMQNHEENEAANIGDWNVEDNTDWNTAEDNTDWNAPEEYSPKSGHHNIVADVEQWGAEVKKRIEVGNAGNWCPNLPKAKQKRVDDWEAEVRKKIREENVTSHVANVNTSNRNTHRSDTHTKLRFYGPMIIRNSLKYPPRNTQQDKQSSRTESKTHSGYKNESEKYQRGYKPDHPRYKDHHQSFPRYFRNYRNEPPVSEEPGHRGRNGDTFVRRDQTDDIKSRHESPQSHKKSYRPYSRDSKAHENSHRSRSGDSKGPSKSETPKSRSVGDRARASRSHSKHSDRDAEKRERMSSPHKEKVDRNESESKAEIENANHEPKSKKRGNKEKKGSNRPVAEKPPKLSKKAKRKQRRDRKAEYYEAHPDAVDSVIRELEGDLFSASHEYSLGHCVAADFRMGAGIAVQFVKEFGGREELLSMKKGVGEVAILERQNRYIFYLVTKGKSHFKPTIPSITKAIKVLREECQRLNVKKIALPRIGCGLDQLNWGVVKQLLYMEFKDTDIEVVIYVLPSK